jgi:hypothetical protein
MLIQKLPKPKADEPAWRAATEALMLAAEERGPLMRAEIGPRKALHPTERVVDPSEKTRTGGAANRRATVEPGLWPFQLVARARCHHSNGSRGFGHRPVSVDTRRNYSMTPCRLAERMRNLSLVELAPKFNRRRIAACRLAPHKLAGLFARFVSRRRKRFTPMRRLPTADYDSRSTLKRSAPEVRTR